MGARPLGANWEASSNRANAREPLAPVPESPQAPGSREAGPLSARGLVSRVLGSMPDRIWRWLALGLLICVVGMMTFWMGANRYLHSWDESEYLNSALTDADAMRTHGLRGLAGSMVHAYNYRPPAYRLVALPAVLTGSVDLVYLRGLAMAGSLIGLGCFCRAVAALTCPAVGMFAALCLGASANFVSVARVVGNEPATYLAIAASMYYLFRAAADPKPSRWTWLGLAFALAVVFSAKLSFPWSGSDVGHRFCPGVAAKVARDARETVAGSLRARVGVGGAVVRSQS